MITLISFVSLHNKPVWTLLYISEMNVSSIYVIDISDTHPMDSWKSSSVYLKSSSMLVHMSIWYHAFCKWCMHAPELETLPALHVD